MKEFKVEKEKDYLIIWRLNLKGEWYKWQNIHKKYIENFKAIKIKEK